MDRYSTRILHEKRVAEHLAFHEYECFVPLQYKKPYRIAPASQNGKQPLSVPLFPGYLFCRYKLQHNFHILRAPGVIRILGYGNTPAVIPDSEIESVQKVVLSGLATEPCQFLQSGQKVQVKSGPFNGVEGYIVTALNKSICKVAVGISVVEKSVVIDVFTADVCAIP